MAGAALCEPRSADCVNLSISADFVASAAIANLEVQFAWRLQNSVDLKACEKSS